MKITINQIAELAQVSKGTVSKVINGHAGISKETRERVQKLIEKLDYHPDSSARALALQRTGVIGFLIPHEPENSLTGNFWPTLLSAVSREAGENDYQVMVLTTSKEGDLRSLINKILKRSTVDGLIIGSELLDKESLSTLILNKLPFVLLGRNPEFQHYCIDVDNGQGMTELLDHLEKKGFKKPGALLGPQVYPYVQDRLAAYSEWMGNRKMKPIFTFADYNRDSVRSQLKTLLSQDMDSLVVTSGGQFYLDTLSYLKEIPFDFTHFGLGVYDNYPILDYLDPRVPAVAQPFEQMGKEASRLLFSLIKGETPDQTVVQLKTHLITRD